MSFWKPLGAGGMGTVYRAQDETLERVVAIKVLSAGMLNDDDARRRFRKEALALAKLNHPHIAAVFDAGNDEGIDYIVMECVPGESLAQKLRSGALSVREATSITLQVAEALEEAHERGVIHRDLKPGNVMITTKGHAKVLDFGLAKLLAPVVSDATMSIETGFLIGTPRYMSPEQAEGKAVDARTDLWSLGVVYHQMLTGQLPFGGSGNIGVLHAITSAAPTLPRTLNAHLPVEAEQIVSRSLEKNPAARYQNASEVVRDTSDLLAGLSASARTAANGPKGRSKHLLVAIACALVVVLAGGSWLAYRWSRRQWAREEAVPQIASLFESRKPLAALGVLEQALHYAPNDPKLEEIVKQNFLRTSLDSTLPGSTIEVQEYSTPESAWRRLGVAPLTNVLLPGDSFLRWRISKPGGVDLTEGHLVQAHMTFDLDALQKGPSGMVPVPGGKWSSNNGANGFFGPYQLPAYSIDRYEVTNADYQKFVDAGGYETQAYWKEKIVRDGHEIPWEEAMKEFRDSTNRPGPAGWAAGHFPEGKADIPVSGVNWFEASAYAVFAKKSLPVLPQWYKAAPVAMARHIIPVSNVPGTAATAGGTFKGQGPYGTSDMAGNVREWVVNEDDSGNRFILGGSWRSPTYDAFLPTAVSGFDRADVNGFRCVVNAGPIPAGAAGAIRRRFRDFSKVKPASDEVFQAYETMYADSINASPRQ